MRSHADELARVVAGAKNGSENDFRALSAMFYSSHVSMLLRHLSQLQFSSLVLEHSSQTPRATQRQKQQAQSLMPRSAIFWKKR
jgi:hypothetical protein